MTTPHRIRSLLQAVSALVGTLLLGVMCTARAGTALPPMERAVVEPGVEIEYRVVGNGDPVVLLHAGLFADWFEPLLAEPALAARHRVLSLHRVGYAGSSRVAGPVSIARQAAQVRALMQKLGISRAHVIGHSSGGNIALQLALDSPQHVHTLSLLEPALPVGTADDRMLATRQAAMASITDAWRKGDKAGAVDGFMRMVSGPAYRTAFDRALPGSFERGLLDAETFFGQELPALGQWQLAREDAARITQPVLAVMGAKSPEVSPIWSARQQLLLTSLPKAEGFVLPDATHLLHLQNPRAMAQALAEFFNRHPIASGR
jgi:pimeloyl-ACP methyl ester carboxylesterase